MTHEINIKKRNGELAPLNIDKIHSMIAKCSDGLDISISEVAISAHIQFRDEMTTKEIQRTLIASANSKISREEPDYEILTGRLLLTDMRKDVYGQFANIPFYDLVTRNIEKGYYSASILDSFTKDEIDFFGSMIDYESDLYRTYSSLIQLNAKYLLKDITTGIIQEMPQEIFMLIPMIIFRNEKNRNKLIIDFYNMLKDDEISLPTPIIAGVRTMLKMYSSCCLISVGDNTDSILSAEYAAGLMAAQRAGLGIDMSRVRGELAGVKNNTVKHTGAFPILKTIESTTKQLTQNGVRQGSTCVFYPFFNWEIMDILDLKSNQGSNYKQVRFIDYGVVINQMLIRRALAGEDITLFSAEEVPDLFELYGDTEAFEERYIRYEKARKIRKKVIPAAKLLDKIIKMRIETGRIYITFLDNVNTQGMLKHVVTQSNLCVEIMLPTEPIQYEGLRSSVMELDEYDGKTCGEIALCILASVNFGKLKNITRLDVITHTLVRFLDNLIDEQEYPMNACEYPTKQNRYLGIGISDYAHFLAKNRAYYTSPRAKELTHKWTERFQYGLLTASNELAKEKGKCYNYEQTKFADGLLPIDTYNKNVDSLGDFELVCDWEKLRANIAEHGVRNVTLSAIPPTANSARTGNNTPGIDPITSIETQYDSADYTVKALAPDFEYEKYYMKTWELEDNNSLEYLKLIAVMQKFICQGISVNEFYDLTKLNNKMLDSNRVRRAIATASKYGLKSMYYITSKDKENVSDSIVVIEDDDECSNCTI